MPFLQTTLPPPKKPNAIALAVPLPGQRDPGQRDPGQRDPEKGQSPLVFNQVHVHTPPSTSPATYLIHTTSRFHNCTSSPWLCVGIVGFLFVLLMLGMSNSGDCVSSDSWLFCDNHPNPHPLDDHHNIVPLFAFLFIVSMFACFWFSGRRPFNW